MTITTPPTDRVRSGGAQDDALAARLDDLLAMMTREQKVAQLQCTIPIAGHLESGLAKFPHGLGASGSISAGVSIEADADHYDAVQTAAAEKTGHGIPPLLHGEAVSG